MQDERDRYYVYQAFWFSHEIKNWFYAGDGFLQYKKDMDADELLDLAEEMMQDDDSMVPGLKNRIESILGEGNYIYDFWEFGPDCFSLYWWIRKTVYLEKMQKIDEWVRYEALENMVFYRIENVKI